MTISKKTILIVDDEESYRHLFSEQLSKEGFAVLQARDGEEGLAMSIKEKPDLILLDLGMPRMDGLSMLSKLREDPWGKHAKVFILTNVSDTAKLAEAIEKESFVYLVKSDMSLDELVSKVKKKITE